MKRIVLVGAYPLSNECIHGGVESSVYGLAQELSKTHEVNVFDMPRIGGVDSVEKGSVFVNRYSNHGSHNEDAISRMQEYLRDIVALHPDVVHIHGTGEFCRALYLGVKHYGYPCIVTIHGLLAVEKRNALRRSFLHLSKIPKAIYQYSKQSKTEYAFLEEIENAIVDTQYVVDALKKYPVHKLPVMNVIPQGINKRFFNLHCDPDSDTILSVGSISQRKGHLQLIKAFNKACAQGMRAKLHIVGVIADEAYYARLKKEIANSPYASFITLTTNATQDDLFSAYQSAKVFALHTQEESQGIVFAEAMAAGLPVVATSVGGVPCVVRDSQEGNLSPFGDIDAFARNIKDIMENQSKWNEFSKSAIQRAAEYDWTNIAERIDSLYEQLKR